jgi:hypothetical protein
MLNCTATQRQNSTGAVYGDYMDGTNSRISNEGSDLSGMNLTK